MGTLLTGGVLAGGSCTDRAAAEREALRALLESWEPSDAVGRQYLTMRAGEASEETLVSLIHEAMGPGHLDRSGEGLQRALRLAVSRDFAEGRLVNIWGWRFSVTEARLLAFTELKKPAPS